MSETQLPIDEATGIPITEVYPLEEDERRYCRRCGQEMKYNLVTGASFCPHEHKRQPLDLSGYTAEYV